jgi:methyl coenzyme M reductase subunit D
MTIEQLKAAYEATPFRPFVIHVADGREIPVQSREFILTVPSGRTIVIVQPDDRMNIVDLLLITDLEFKTRFNGASKRRRA